MRELPSGTVTFLFSDIEGSTKLLDELGLEAYAKALAEHRRVMRETFAAHGGVEVDTQGDAFFVAFPEAQGALAAAAQAQARLAAGLVCARMGIHSGEPLVTEEGYVGMDVHRGARVMSAGHGGQVLVSQATYALLDGDSGLIELGRHRLKDLTEPQPLFQLGDGEFPPLKTLYQTNLPVQPTPLVGRESELAEVLELLSSSRLLTLTGAGGSGKTRLALQAAAELVDEYRDGVWWVSLAALRDTSLVEPTIAQVVGAKDGLADHLRDKQTLLLLDNFEQVVEAAPAIAQLLSEAPDARVLATSRERLGVRAEQEYEVPSLVPAEAVALFTTRARQLKPGFEPDEHVGEICRRLDGLPLALELAAARVKVLSAEQILARLAHGLEFLTNAARDAPERQQTLRATIDWSYELLGEGEQRLFARLAVFAGSFDFEAAEAVCAADLDALAALVEKSLLRRGDQGRFFMLETIREYAAERLVAGNEADALSHRHAAWCLALAERADREIRGGEQAKWLHRLEAELDNMRAALSWSLEGSDPATGLRLYPALSLFFFQRDYIAEEAVWAEKAVSRLAGASPDVTARVLWAAGTAALFTERVDSAEQLLQRSLIAARDADDQVQSANALLFLGAVATMRGELPRAIVVAESALRLYRDARDEYGIALALHHLGERYRDAGEYGKAAKLLAESATLWHRQGNRLDGAQSLHSLGDIALDQEEFDRAEGLYREGLEVARGLEAERFQAYCLAGIAAAAAGKGDWSRAGRLWGAVEAIEEAIQVRLLREERSRYERLLSDPGSLDPDALTEGRALTAEAAVEYALTSID